ncbi:MAG: sigma-70 family RNA polymerase sigma factor [Myxococcales bacterium]|nr:sigma-70 family RNA polymerase sigma factor [Myxococcales bacterium]
MTRPQGAGDRFEPQRRRLFGLAYRMLGSRAEAEDVVQDAFVRFQGADLGRIAEPAAYLSTTVTRLCLDRLKSARRRREAYVGTWLPEPLLSEADPPTPDKEIELAEDLSFALLLTLERLTPAERAAFLLHDVFGVNFEQLGEVLQREPASCRKLAQRARDRIHRERPRFTIEPDEEQRLVTAFFEASASGDPAKLTDLLTEDAIVYSDGGGKRRAALNPVIGRERVVRFVLGVQSKATFETPQALISRRVNQLPGVVVQYASGELAVAGFELRDGRIARIYYVNNPDKLAHLRSEM